MNSRIMHTVKWLKRAKTKLEPYKKLTPIFQPDKLCLCLLHYHSQLYKKGHIYARGSDFYLGLRQNEIVCFSVKD